MGTRGAFGVIVGEQEKIGYNQFDSYPEGKGREVLAWLRGVVAEEGGVEKTRVLAEGLRLVTDKEKPTAIDIERLAPFTDLDVSEQSTDDWYCLTRLAHGDIAATLACGYVLDAHNFPLDSLFCEWAYIVNFDTQTFEVYGGFIQEKHDRGRFAGRETPVEDGAWIDGGYWPVALIASWPFDALPTDGAFLAATNEEEEVLVS